MKLVSITVFALVEDDDIEELVAMAERAGMVARVAHTDSIDEAKQFVRKLGSLDLRDDRGMGL